MSRAFEELDRRVTRMGEISLRRRLEPVLQVDVWEVKLDDDFLMSSLFTASEEAVARLGLAALDGEATGLDVVVGGLGLGHTVMAALDDPRVASLHVVEALGEVIDWHHEHLVPLGAAITTDTRCRLVHGDFFALVDAGLPFAPDGGGFDAILVDIDHSPTRLLDDDHTGFYTPDGLRRVAEQLRRGGAFALWSDDPPDEAFTELLCGVFAFVKAHVVSFPNHYTGGESACTVYVATT